MSEQNIYSRLMNEIKNEYGVCGLIGNLKKESGLCSINMQNSYERKLNMTDESYTKAVDNGTYTDFCKDRCGYGLAQWTSEGRKTGLFNHVKSRSKSIGDENAQIDYLIYELNNGYKKVMSVLKNAKSVEEASDIVVLKYEVPASVLPKAGEESKNKTLAQRRAIGNEFYKKYCKKEEIKMVKIALDAGHGLSTPGKRCLKSLDRNETREWYLNDRIADRLEILLSGYNCEVLRVGDTNGIKDYFLKDRVKKANNWKADVYVSIHHNAGINGGSGGGTVVYYYSSNANRAKQAHTLYNEVVKLTGLVGNRSSKVIKKGFYVLANTSMPAFLIENGFMDSSTDVPVILSAECAENTAQGLLSFLVKEFSLTKNNNVTPSPIPNPKPVESPVINKPTTKFVKSGVDYSLVFEPTYYSNKYPDLKKAFGDNSTNLFNHFCSYGMKEGRQAIANFNVTTYKNRYVDLQKAFGNDLPSYYKHYVQFGHKEKRVGV